MSKKAEDQDTTSKLTANVNSRADTKLDARCKVKNALVSCKEAAADRTFFLPLVIVCTLFTFQALSG